MSATRMVTPIAASITAPITEAMTPRTQDSAAVRSADSLRADSLRSAASMQPDSATLMAPPPMKMPENSGYLMAAYTVAGCLYVGYLVILMRRWTALKRRQQQGALRNAR